MEPAKRKLPMEFFPRFRPTERVSRLPRLRNQARATCGTSPLSKSQPARGRCSKMCRAIILIIQCGRPMENAFSSPCEKKGAQNEATLYSPAWARDEGSIFCQNMTNIYQISLDGRVLAQWKIEKAIPNGGMSGDGRITVSPDGELLLLSIDMGEEHNRKDWDGPPPALWTFEIATQKVVRITPKTLFGWDSCWIDSTNILCLSQEEGKKTASLYRMSIDGKNLKRLI